jgi:hypothetical protein
MEIAASHTIIIKNKSFLRTLFIKTVDYGSFPGVIDPVKMEFRSAWAQLPRTGMPRFVPITL